MTGVPFDRLVAHLPDAPTRSPRRSSAGRTISPWWPTLGLIVLLGATSSLHAQQWPGNPSYPQGYPQPIQPAQNIYYGNYQNNTVPGYIYPRPNPMNSNGYPNGNGVTYYYVQNPYGSSPYPYYVPNGPPAPMSTPTRTPSWPMPSNTPPPVTRYVPTEEDLLGDGRKPTVSFHRPTNENYWASGDYLGAFIRPMRLPAGPLATLGSARDNLPGANGQPGTSPLGPGSVDFGLQSGFRLEAGMFLDCANQFSIELGGFYTLPRTQSFGIGSDVNGNPVLARPIFNVVTGIEASFLTAFPGFIAGNLSIESRSEMAGIELNARYHAYIRKRLHVDGLVGFRYLRLDEQVRIEENLNPIANNFVTFLGNSVNQPNSLRDQDSFRTINQFFGPQIGGRLAWEYNWFRLDGYAKLALGPTVQQANINGSTTLVTPAGNQTANGGILALPSNSGNHTRTAFGIVPEFGLNVGVDLTPHVRLQLGYSILLWNRVLRPGGQMDHAINPTQAPGSPGFGQLGGPSVPVYRFNDELFWSNMLKIGLEIHY